MLLQIHRLYHRLFVPEIKLLCARRIWILTVETNLRERKRAYVAVILTVLHRKLRTRCRIYVLRVENISLLLGNEIQRWRFVLDLVGRWLLLWVNGLRRLPMYELGLNRFCPRVFFRSAVVFIRIRLAVLRVNNQVLLHLTLCVWRGN